ncbi:MAG: hypothetical protein KF884_01140 [Fimbriimonadaceae bacterium]|nr:hypothetical protein [Fimbriimonadaceae bacterium]QYK58701.1 MAG: hypothetical protein KF884_01140 [Fimbriimonadaceae bacterium]
MTPACLMALFALGGCLPRQDGANPQGGPRFASRQDLDPTKIRHLEARLVLAGTEVPVTLEPQIQGSEFNLLIRAKGAVMETERYQVNDQTFAFVGGTGEEFVPPIPILRFPLEVGEKWTWTGVAALGPVKKKANADVTTGLETLNIVSGVSDSVVVTVDLSIEAQPGLPAARRLRFWIDPKDGLVKRDFAHNSLREPRPKSDEGT